MDDVNQTPPFVFVFGNEFEVVEGGVGGRVHQEVAKLARHALLLDCVINQSSFTFPKYMPKPS